MCFLLSDWREGVSAFHRGPGGREACVSQAAGAQRLSCLGSWWFEIITFGMNSGKEQDADEETGPAAAGTDALWKVKLFPLDRVPTFLY